MRSVQELMDLRGRVALVTGGGGHIGAAIGQALAECGAAVALVDVDQQRCREEAERIRDSLRVEAVPLAVDLRDEKALREIPQAVGKVLGRLDILVNCAGLAPGAGTPFPLQTLETWRWALEVNLTAAFVLTQVSVEMLAATGRGVVLNIGSIYGVVGPNLQLYEDTPMGQPAGYAASKGGLIQLTRHLATVLAPNVRVNALSPGGVWRNQPQAFHDRYVEKCPLRRMALEEDFKGAAAYLCSDLSSYVTGQNLMVDGGWTVW
jgi:NAD(P)-dependent dehydrogenase (short-subunit alcohol dehydrogenase family)